MAAKKIRVCVAGAGAAGLCAARHLAADLKSFEPVVFEQTSNVGGTWNYTDNVGLDEHNLPIHSSMYKYLRTNLPMEVMEYPDFRKIKGDGPSCVTHEVVLAYLKEYTDHFQLRPFIEFNTIVEHVQPTKGSNERWSKWDVRVRNVITTETRDLQFDAVMVCNGHYSTPHIPDIDGLSTFPGQVLHSHSYRKPEDFAGKTVVILGAQSSGIDISLELSKFAHHVYLCHNLPRLTTKFPESITQLFGINRIEGKKFFLTCGTTVTADTLLFCTGYLFKYDFLDKSCGISVDDNFVYPLYKHMINVAHPSMSLLGIPCGVVPFPMFHMQVQYHLAILKNKSLLPATTKMSEDATASAEHKSHTHILASAQWSYNDSLARKGGFAPLPAIYKIAYEAWHRHRQENLEHYKNYNLFIDDNEQSVKIIPA